MVICSERARRALCPTPMDPRRALGVVFGSFAQR